MKERVEQIYTLLLRQYPDVACTLNVINPEFFLFSNILSPQCTDRVANSIAKKLYETYRTVQNVADAPQSEIQEIIHSCGLHNVKSQNIKGSAQLLVEKFNGKLPQTLAELTEFPGIGRKTALVILHEIFEKNEGIVIDTHNIRIANRIGITDSKNAVKVEKDLAEVTPKDKWRLISHLFVSHGRACCVARDPKCPECPIKDLCEYGINL